jgi:hypothetical protein
MVRTPDFQHRDGFIEWSRARTAAQAACRKFKRDREAQKAARLQAELDALKPKSLEMLLYSRSIRMTIRGAKCGYQMGGSRI